MIGLQHFLTLGAALFCIGLYGALSKRNAIAVLMSIELMLNSININRVAFNRYTDMSDLAGQLFAIFVIIVAAAEVAIGLALVLAIYKNKSSVELNDFNWLKW